MIKSSLGALERRLGAGGGGGGGGGARPIDLRAPTATAAYAGAETAVVREAIGGAPPNEFRAAIGGAPPNEFRAAIGGAPPNEFRTAFCEAPPKEFREATLEGAICEALAEERLREVVCVGGCEGAAVTGSIGPG